MANRWNRWAATALLFLFTHLAASAQPALSVVPLAEKKVETLPAGTLFWRIETLPSLTDARAAAGPYAIAVEAAGKAWLFTLGPAGGSTAGAQVVSEVGPHSEGGGGEVLAANQRRERATGERDAGAQPPRLGSVLRARR